MKDGIIAEWHGALFFEILTQVDIGEHILSLLDCRVSYSAQ